MYIPELTESEGYCRSLGGFSKPQEENRPSKSIAPVLVHMVSQ